jgi:hypothetical protein
VDIRSVRSRTTQKSNIDVVGRPNATPINTGGLVAKKPDRKETPLSAGTESVIQRVCI